MNKAQEAIYVALKNAHCDARVAGERMKMHCDAWDKNKAVHYAALDAVPVLREACRTLGLTEAEIEQAGEWVKE